MIRARGEVGCVLLRWEGEVVTVGTALAEALLAEGASEGWADVVGTARTAELSSGEGGTELLTGAISLRASGPVTLDELAPLATVSFRDALGARTIVGELGAVEAVRVDASLWYVAPRAPAAARPPAQPVSPAPPPAAPGAPERTADPGPPVGLPSASLPAKRATTKVDDGADYPEAGDLATHFLFGECEVIESDGDRIRLRQTKDGRMREVSLGVLVVKPPTTLDGRKHFLLGRKN